MDNAGIASLAGVSRTCEQWIACVVFILLVMKLFEKYSAGLAGTTQLQANRMSVLGNSVGQLSGAVYLPLMVALAGAIPLFIGVVVTSGVGSTWFGACGVIPFRPDGLTAALQQAYWLADQFLPINFLILLCALVRFHSPDGGADMGHVHARPQIPNLLTYD